MIRKKSREQLMLLTWDKNQWSWCLNLRNIKKWINSHYQKHYHFERNILNLLLVFITSTEEKFIPITIFIINNQEDYSQKINQNEHDCLIKEPPIKTWRTLESTYWNVYFEKGDLQIMQGIYERNNIEKCKSFLQKEALGRAYQNIVFFHQHFVCNFTKVRNH